MTQGASTEHIPPMSTAPPGYTMLPPFEDFYRPLHEAFAGKARQHIAARRAVLGAALGGTLPDYLPTSEANGEHVSAYFPWPKPTGCFATAVIQTV